MKRLLLLAPIAALAATCTALGAPPRATPSLTLDLPPGCSLRADEPGLGWNFVGTAGTRQAIVTNPSAAPFCGSFRETARAALRGLWSGVVKAWEAEASTNPHPDADDRFRSLRVSLLAPAALGSST